jgi:hypothetical protein
MIVVDPFNDKDSNQYEGNVRDNRESNASQKSSQSNLPIKEDELVLSNLGIDLLDVVYSLNATREFKTKGQKGFFGFGDQLPGNRINPNFEFASVKQATKIISPIDGFVVNIQKQEDSKDYEVFLQTIDGSKWVVGFDHLIDLKVKNKDIVKVGQLLGYPQVQGNGLYRFEIQINNEENGKTTYYCPTGLLDSSVKDSIGKQITDMLSQWEKTTSLDLYTQESQKLPGCISEKFSDQ